MFHTLATRAAELISVAHSAARWQQKRCLTRFIGRLCDRLFDRTSTRSGKNTPSLEKSTCEQHRARLMEMRRLQRETPTVVFFGDASYGPTMRDHSAIPKKGILRELCHRGLTVAGGCYRHRRVARVLERAHAFSASSTSRNRVSKSTPTCCAHHGTVTIGSLAPCSRTGRRSTSQTTRGLLVRS